MSGRGPQLLLDFVLFSTDLRHQHLSGVIKQGVIHPVVPPADPDHLLEQLTPEDFSWSVRGSGLMQHTCGVVCVSKRHHQLKVCFPQTYQTHLVQRAARFDPVEDGGRCDQDDVPLLDDQIFVGHIHFPRGMHCGADNLSASRPLHQVVPAEVSDSPGKTQVSIAKIDDGAVAEAHRLRPLSGRGHFGDNNSDDKRVDEAADNILYSDDDNGNHAVLRHSSETVANGGLSFKREEESSCEAAHLVHAGIVCVVFYVIVSESDDPVEDAEEEPGQDVRQGKDQEHHPPSDLHQGGEDVGHKQQPLLGNMAKHNVTAAFFAYVAVFLWLWSILSLHTDVIGGAHRCILFLHLPESVGKITKNV